MKNLNNHWWGPLFGIPMILGAILIAFYGVLYPLLSHDNFHIGMGSLQTIELIAVLTAIVTPVIIWRFYNTSLVLLFGLWVPVTFMGLFLETGNYEGNHNLGMAGYLFGYQLLSSGLSIIFTLRGRMETMLLSKK